MISLQDRGGKLYVRKMINGTRYEEATGYSVGEEKKARLAGARIIGRWLDEANGLVPKRVKEVPSERLTFGAWVERYLAAYTEGSAVGLRARRRTLELWRTFPTGNKTAPTWEEMSIADITEDLCLASIRHRRSLGMQDARQKGKPIKESTLGQEQTHVQAAFTRAVKNRVIDENPWEGIDQEVGTPRRSILPLDKEAAFFAELPPAIARQASFILETGLRISECLGVEARDVRNGRVHVHGKSRIRRTVCPVCGRTGGKPRDIWLTKKARQLLKEQFAEGAWPEYNSLAYHMQLASKTVGIPRLGPHDLRRTFGTRWLTGANSTGVRGDIYALSKVLGHESVVVTEQHYAHLMDSDIDRRIREVLGD